MRRQQWCAGHVGAGCEQHSGHAGSLCAGAARDGIRPGDVVSLEQGELTANTELTGVFARDEAPTDPDSVLVIIEDAREEALQRALAAAEG